MNTDSLAGRASVSQAAILSSQAQEDLKIGIIWGELEQFILAVAECAGVAVNRVGYRPFKLCVGEMTDVEKSTVLQGWVDRGVGLESVLGLDGVLCGRHGA
ncbi:MAG: hypothetical protein FWG87_11970 [Defluviitaleaceae bacterium]|nr:hypothetical protein [Defluviitaleaceae bacterium]